MEVGHLWISEKIFLTLFHVDSEPTYFTLGGEFSFPPSNFVIFEDRDLKFGDDA